MFLFHRFWVARVAARCVPWAAPTHARARAHAHGTVIGLAIPRADRGLSLAECLCTLALMAGLSLQAVPTLESLAQRLRVDGVRERWLSDLDLARSWSARHGAASLLARRTDCPGLSDARDWRCGWRVVSADTAEVLSDTPLQGEVSLVYSTTTGELRVAATGDPMSGGASLHIKPWRAEWLSLATTICLNIAGRVHWQPGEGCA